MDRRRWLAGWVAGLSAAALVSGPMSGPVSASDGSRSLSSVALQSVLVRTSDLPPGSAIFPPYTLAQVAAGGGLGNTPGMTSSPASCLTFVADALPGLGSMVGWMQFGARQQTIGGVARHLAFAQMAADVPGGAKVRRFGEAVESCRRGTLTVEGHITAQVAFTTLHLHMKSASVFATTMATTFPTTMSAQDIATLAKYNFHPGRCDATYVFVGKRDVLVWGLDPDLTQSVHNATIMHDRVLQALGT